MRWGIIGLLSAACGGEPLKTAKDSAGGPVVPTDSASEENLDVDGDGVERPGDCDDNNAMVFPGAEEVCNEADDDCDGEVDEGLLLAFYLDSDGDGHGDPTEAVWACALPEGASTLADDCNDADALVSPSAVEECNDADDNCNGLVDEDVEIERYVDSDGDGWGDAERVESTCPDASGYADVSGDCDDANPQVHPGVVSDSCDGEDSDCDGDIDEDSKLGWSLLTVDTNDNKVYEVDPASAALSTVVSLSTTRGINSMDVSENGMSVVHTHTSPSSIEFFDACTGDLTAIGPHGTSGIGGIGFGPGGRLFGIGSNDRLWEFDLTTGAATSVGSLGIDIGNSGLAWDCTHSKMYGADGSGDRIFEIDLSTGQASNIRSTSVPFSSVGLEYDHRSGLLYASTGTALYTVEPSTGSTTYVGNLDASNVDDLAWHPVCP